MTENQKLHMIKKLQTYGSTLEKENIKLKKAIDRQIKKSGVQLPHDQNEDFIQIMKESENDALCDCASAESNQHLF